MKTLIPTTISASDARSQLYVLLDKVSNELRRFILTKNGQAKAVLISPEELEAWEETMEVISEKKLLSQILRSEEERKSGKKISEKKLLNELG